MTYFTRKAACIFAKVRQLRLNSKKNPFFLVKRRFSKAWPIDGDKKTGKSKAPSCPSSSPGISIYFPWCSSETVNFLRPLARREASTRRPFLLAILSRKPCLLTLLRLWGWNVLFIVVIIVCLLLFLLSEGYDFTFWAAKVHISFQTTKNYPNFSEQIALFLQKNRIFAPNNTLVKLICGNK